MLSEALNVSHVVRQILTTKQLGRVGLDEAL